MADLETLYKKLAGLTPNLTTGRKNKGDIVSAYEALESEEDRLNFIKLVTKKIEEDTNKGTIDKPKFSAATFIYQDIIKAEVEALDTKFKKDKGASLSDEEKEIYESKAYFNLYSFKSTLDGHEHPDGLLGPVTHTTLTDTECSTCITNLVKINAKEPAAPAPDKQVDKIKGAPANGAGTGNTTAPQKEPTTYEELLKTIKDASASDDVVKKYGNKFAEELAKQPAAVKQALFNQSVANLKLNPASRSDLWAGAAVISVIDPKPEYFEKLTSENIAEKITAPEVGALVTAVISKDAAKITAAKTDLDAAIGTQLSVKADANQVNKDRINLTPDNHLEKRSHSTAVANLGLTKDQLVLMENTIRDYARDPKTGQLKDDFRKDKFKLDNTLKTGTNGAPDLDASISNKADIIRRLVAHEDAGFDEKTLEGLDFEKQHIKTYVIKPKALEPLEKFGTAQDNKIKAAADVVNEHLKKNGVVIAELNEEVVVNGEKRPAGIAGVERGDKAAYFEAGYIKELNPLIAKEIAARQAKLNTMEALIGVGFPDVKTTGIDNTPTDQGRKYNEKTGNFDKPEDKATSTETSKVKAKKPLDVATASPDAMKEWGLMDQDGKYVSLTYKAANGQDTPIKADEAIKIIQDATKPLEDRKALSAAIGEKITAGLKVEEDADIKKKGTSIDKGGPAARFVFSKYRDATLAEQTPSEKVRDEAVKKKDEFVQKIGGLYSQVKEYNELGKTGLDESTDRKVSGDAKKALNNKEDQIHTTIKGMIKNLEAQEEADQATLKNPAATKEQKDAATKHIADRKEELDAFKKLPNNIATTGHVDVIKVINPAAKDPKDRTVLAVGFTSDEEADYNKKEAARKAAEEAKKLQGGAGGTGGKSAPAPEGKDTPPALKAIDASVYKKDTDGLAFTVQRYLELSGKKALSDDEKGTLVPAKESLTRLAKDIADDTQTNSKFDQALDQEVAKIRADFKAKNIALADPLVTAITGAQEAEKAPAPVVDDKPKLIQQGKDGKDQVQLGVDQKLSEALEHIQKDLSTLTSKSVSPKSKAAKAAKDDLLASFKVIEGYADMDKSESSPYDKTNELLIKQALDAGVKESELEKQGGVSAPLIQKVKDANKGTGHTK